VLVGTSQTWGAGATTDERTWARQLEARLGPERVQIVNTGMSGLVSGDLLDFYRRDWIRYEPDLVVVNLASNDEDGSVLAANVESLLQLNKTRGIRTLVSLEANATEGDNEALRERHEKLRAVAQAADVPVVDLHGCLETRADSGFLWWDFVHLTDFGQKLAADCLFDDVRRLISSLDTQ
jgi:lysophospholipase L1-like esterase